MSSVCGYLAQQSVMLEFQHIAYLQFFGRVRRDTFVNDRIAFSNNACGVSVFVNPFLKQLRIVDGCQFGTVEVLWPH
jgi:hypothetical protein